MYSYFTIHILPNDKGLLKWAVLGCSVLHEGQRPIGTHERALESLKMIAIACVAMMLVRFLTSHGDDKSMMLSCLVHKPSEDQAMSIC